MFYTEIVDELLDHDAIVKTKNTDGWIPLDEAVSYGNREMSETTCYGYNKLLQCTAEQLQSVVKYMALLHGLLTERCAFWLSPYCPISFIVCIL